MGSAGALLLKEARSVKATRRSGSRRPVVTKSQRRAGSKPPRRGSPTTPNVWRDAPPGRGPAPRGAQSPGRLAPVDALLEDAADTACSAPVGAAQESQGLAGGGSWLHGNN